MFILPFVHTTQISPPASSSSSSSSPAPSPAPAPPLPLALAPRLQIIRILTLGGTDLWQEEEVLRLKEDVLDPNGLPLLCYDTYKGIHFCQLDPSRMDLSEYYEWDEVDPTVTPSVFCWRTFYWMGDVLPPPQTARLGPFSCKEIVQQCIALSEKREVSTS